MNWDGSPDATFGVGGRSEPTPTSLHPIPGELQMRFIARDGLGHVLAGGNVVRVASDDCISAIVRFFE